VSPALACIAEDAPDLLVAIRRGTSPLVVGLGDGEMFLASDIPALVGVTREVVVLEEGDLAVMTRDRVVRRSLDGGAGRWTITRIPWEGDAAEKAGHPHFMLKEIFEQPDAVRNTLRERVDPETGDIRIPELGLKDRDLVGLNRLCFVACGTSWHAALVGRYLVKAFARLPVEVDIASEFRYDEPVLDGRVLTVPTSQSGETADTLADAVLSIPPAPHWIQPLLVALPLQLLAYHVGVLRGCDVDQPRNLAKSVTVE
jgi:glucosamine--fructose-6-phosphate aminotransferase (isomerizing)